MHTRSRFLVFNTPTISFPCLADVILQIPSVTWLLRVDADVSGGLDIAGSQLADFVGADERCVVTVRESEACVSDNTEQFVTAIQKRM